MAFRHKRERLRTFDETSAYARCHGDRDDSVRIVVLPTRRVRYDELLATGEDIRRMLEQRIDARETVGETPEAPTGARETFGETLEACPYESPTPEAPPASVPPSAAPSPAA